MGLNSGHRATPTPPDQRDRQQAYRCNNPEQAWIDDHRLEPARNVCFFATVADDAIQYFCRLPASWKAAFTADAAYRVTIQQVAAVRASGHRAFAWGDCDQTPPVLIREFAEMQGLDGWYGQAESDTQFDNANGGAQLPQALIGNLSALRPDQLSRVAAGDVVFINETYYNVPGNVGAEGPDWRNANAGVGGNCLAVYGSSSEGAIYLPLREQIRRGYFDAADDSLYVEGFLEDDWAALLEVAR